MAITMGEATVLVAARIKASQFGSGWDGIREILAGTSINPDEGVEALAGIGQSIAAPLIGMGVLPPDRVLEDAAVAALVGVLAGYEVGLSEARDGE